MTIQKGKIYFSSIGEGIAVIVAAIAAGYLLHDAWTGATKS
jgi:hypothetical protein